MIFMNQTTITLDPIALQIFSKLLHSTALTIAGMLCMKLIHIIYERLGSAPKKRLPASAKEVTIQLTDKQLNQIKLAMGHAPADPENIVDETEKSLPTQTEEVSIQLTDEQRRQIKLATGQVLTELKVTRTEKHSYPPASVRAVFDSSKWLAKLHNDPAMMVLQFTDKWALAAIFIVYLGLKMYVNIMKWTS
jgi:hypothetical protein